LFCVEERFLTLLSTTGCSASIELEKFSAQSIASGSRVFTQMPGNYA